MKRTQTLTSRQGNFTITVEHEGKTLYRFVEKIQKPMVVNKVVVIETKDEFGFENGIGVIFGEGN